MAARLTAAEREELSSKAVELSAKGWSNVSIAEEIGVNRNTVPKLIENELARRSEHRGPDREASIARNLAVIQAAWQRFETTDNRSLNASGYLNTIIRAGERIDKLTGAEAPIKVADATESYEVVWGDADDYAAEEAGQA